MAAKLSILIAALTLTATACGEDDAKTCEATVCDPATHGKICVGHAIQTCSSDGKAFAYDDCSSQQRCEAGACVPRACTRLGYATCATVTTVERCKDDGSGEETIPCPADTTCRDGACLPGGCRESDPDRCTTNGYVSCESANWVQNNCPVGDVCSVNADGVAGCNPAICAPDSRRCDGNVAKVCDVRGAFELSVPCEDGDVCVAGVCQAEVCGVVTPTEVSDTVGEAEVAEPESRIVFTLNGVANSFDISAFAQFVAGQRLVQVRAGKAQKVLELQFKPATMTIAGAFKSDVANPTRVVVCYDDGGADPGFTGDCAGFTHRSTAYDVLVTTNEGEGGRFEASFSATLEDKNTDTIALTAGQVNVKYR